MAKSDACRCIGILTSGGDCPGLNAAIRAITRVAAGYGIEVVGIRDGFRGLVERRAEPLRAADVSGILTRGGTILGTSRDKPNKMPMGKAGKMDMTAAAIQNYHYLHLDCLVCLGGNGTQKNAARLAREGNINVVTLPKTIDNDVAMTEVSFGFDTALAIATDAIDRLHSTADSHHRVMVVEVMGHKAGWLALSAGVAGGADVILIPEIPYDPDAVAATLKERARSGKRFSIVAVAEGAMSRDEAAAAKMSEEGKKGGKNDEQPPSTVVGSEMYVRATVGQRVAREVEQRIGFETRVASLGHLQRGGTPTAADRILASQLGARAMELIAAGKAGFMMAIQGGKYVPVPLEDVAGKLKLVPLDDPLLKTAREVDTCLGD
ncbi:MAG: 6-phosphofructokinase [Planctomycetes bacterium]|nr:6-phosphofructokinase [Planctomycetota bacterium]